MLDRLKKSVIVSDKAQEVANKALLDQLSQWVSDVEINTYFEQFPDLFKNHQNISKSQIYRYIQAFERRHAIDFAKKYASVLLDAQSKYLWDFLGDKKEIYAKHISNSEIATVSFQDNTARFFVEVDYIRDRNVKRVRVKYTYSPQWVFMSWEITEMERKPGK